MTDPECLPDGSILLHIGPQKTGSTALQSSMHQGREALAAQGVCYPGKRLRPQSAGWAVMGVAAVGRTSPPISEWTTFVEEVQSTDLPRVCVSNEDFGRAGDSAIERIVGDLGADRIHLVFVARRLDKLLPSHWQERVKAKMTMTYEEFLHHVLDTPEIDWEATVTWEPHDVEKVVGRWAKYLPREQMTVIVSEEQDRRLVPEVFEKLLGLSPQTLEPVTIANRNTSLTFTQTEAVRHLNQVAKDESWTPQQYWRIVQEGVVKALRKAGPETGGPRITGLPAWAIPLVAERSQAQVDAILSSGVRVIGDPQRLLLDANAKPVEVPASPETIPMDMAVRLVSGAVEGAGSLHKRQLREARSAKKSPGHRPAESLSGRELVRLLGKKAARRVSGR